MNIEALRRAIGKGKLEWRRHALEQMTNRAITRDGVLQVIFSGEIVEDYPKDHPFPSTLLLGWFQQQPLHVVCAYDQQEDRAFIITAYEPSPDKWEVDFKTRRIKL